ncbi:MAG: hypothetical protein H6628_02275 [Calditrichae bacterium]|nr:hypothetical protein [Calditrichia bacterium]
MFELKIYRKGHEMVFRTAAASVRRGRFALWFILPSLQLFFSPFGLSQTTLPVSNSGTQYAVEHLSSREGLPDNAVRSILQDRRGFIWLGTDAGLCRYDGRDFKIFRKDPIDPGGLRDNRIKCLYQDRAGRLWVGTVAGGLHRYNAGLENFEHWSHDDGDENSLSANGVSVLCEDHTGTLWIGTMGAGLNALDPESGTITRYQHHPDTPHSLGNDFVRAIYEDSQGRLWIGSDAGLDTFDRTQQLFRRQAFRQPPHNRSGTAVGVIHGDDDGMLWLGTPFGLVRFDPAGGDSRIWQPAAATESYEENRVTAIQADSGGTLWIGTLSHGLHLFDRENFRAERIAAGTSGSLPGTASVNAIFRDRSGMIWAGTFNGIYKISAYRIRFHDWNRETGHGKLTSNYIWPIYEDREGVIWIGTLAGLNAWHPTSGQITHYVHDPENPASLSDNAVIAVSEDSRGGLWAGTFTGGLNRLNRQTGAFQHWRHDPGDPQSLPHNLVGRIYEDRSGTLWIATAQGLATFSREQDRVIRYPGPGAKPVMQDQYISDMLEDREGHFWIATLQGGLHRLDRRQGSVRQWRTEPGNPHAISANAVTDIIELPDRAHPAKYYLWLGTEGGGLNRFDPQTGRFRAFTEADGLADNTLSSMVADEAGNIWCATPKGLTQFDPATGSCRTYDGRDGIPNVQFNPWAGLKTRAGRLFFGTPEGMIYFDPQQLAGKGSDLPPPLVFTSLEVFNRPVKIGKDSPLQVSVSEAQTVRLSHREDIFSLTFAALDYTRPEQNRYAYQMEGLHEEWIDLGTRNRIDFTGLSAGEYLLRVKAANSRGSWNEEGARLAIIIAPPFWQAWWFRLLLIAGMGGLLYSFYRMRLGHMLEVERTRTRIARDLHDEVSATLSGISWFAKAAQETQSAPPAEGEPDFHRLIIESAGEAQEKIRDIIWAIQPEHDDWGSLFAHCQRYAADLLESKGIHPHLEVIPPAPPKPLKMATRQHFWLLFKEILTNTVRHADCRTVQITLTAARGEVFLEVADDGKGFDPAQTTSGNGLKNIRARAKALGADCQLHSRTGEGTCWTVRFGMG